jgi:hypothetical protein
MSQPTAMRPSTESRAPWASSARSSTTVLATERARPNTSPPQRPAPEMCDRERQRGGSRHLCHRAGKGNRAHRQEVAEREVHADPKHQEHDPDVGQRTGELGVGHKPGRKRPHRHARQEIAEERRQAQAHREQARHKRDGQAYADGRNQRRFVRHRRGLLGW